LNDAGIIEQRMSSPSPQADHPWLAPPVVVKVGGSLFDWPELSTRLQSFLATLKESNVLLIPGGGPTADVIRQFDQCHRLGEETSHWLALHALSLNARFLQKILPSTQVVEGLNAARSCWRRGTTPILDMYRFARGDEARPDHLPHTWQVTSDSLAARVAVVAEATKLILLKSMDAPSEDWAEAERLGYVDACFRMAVGSVPFSIHAIDLRRWSPHEA
jgi:5-(aminomethyl)-3-furanmethanol phosphate kinase